MAQPWLDARWHLRAATAGARWRSTRAALATFLAQAPRGHRMLLLVGPSAGWLMDRAFLARFDRIDAVDVEWAAAPLFRLRHGHAVWRRGARLRFQRREALSALPEMLAAYPQALVLFDNVLGQYTLTCRDLQLAESRLADLQRQLAGRAWGSIHDALSGEGAACAPGAEPPVQALAPGQPWPDARLLDLVQARGGEWTDHLTRGVLPATVPSWLVPWQLVPGRWHWLQAGWVPA